MATQKKIELSFIIILIAVTLGLSFSLKIIFADWLAPTQAPPNGNVPAPINTGPGTQTKQGNLNLEGSVMQFTQAANTDFYIDSQRGIQFRVNANNASSSTFSINNGANNRVFSIDETGQLTTGSVPADRIAPPGSCSQGQNLQWNGSAWICSFATYAN